MRRLWIIGLAASWNELRPLQVKASKQFELPETLEDLAQQIDFFENPLYQQVSGCRSADAPFLLRYDTLENGSKVPVCLNESQVIARRLNPSLCNTKVTLGEKVDGGCSQYNFFRGVVLGTGYLDDFADLTEDGIVAVPMHRNVPFYHKNTESSPAFPTQEYYHEAEYLPCELEFNFEDNDSADKLQILQQQDLADTNKETGYCDTDPIVKEKLCWSGSGASASADQNSLVNGSYFDTKQPCDVMQHAEPRATSSIYKRLSIHTPSRYDQRAVSVTSQNQNAAEEEATQQNCVRDGIAHLDDLEAADWYTGNDPENTPTKDYWTKSWRNNYNICRFKRFYRCFDKAGNTCAEDREGDCDVYNAHRYTITGVNKCLRKTISRKWTGTLSGKNRRVATRRYTATAKNAEKYFSATSTEGTNACANDETAEECKNKCYAACKDMKYPAFSIKRNGDDRCVCRDYASKDLCPAGQWKSTISYTSYAIPPRCSSEACNRKTVYEENLKPCQFTPVYRKRKCLEACAAKNSLFMTISESGLCMCSKASRRPNNTPVRFQSGQACPWSTSVRVYKDKENEIPNKGYLGDSYVSNTPVETYQLMYASYFETDRTPEDGVLVCENGSPVQEIYKWFATVTGRGFQSAVSIQDVKEAYQNLNTPKN